MGGRTFPGRALLTNALLAATSVLVAFALGNAMFLLWVRGSARQSAAVPFPRGMVGSLPSPLRLSYADLGPGRGDQEILLLGDSYVEGAGDAYNSGAYAYSVGHHLHALTGATFLAFGISGSYLPEAIRLYEQAIGSGLWPLYPGRPPADRPRRALLFFYEGNDLENLFTARRQPDQPSRAEIPWDVRFFPLKRFLELRFTEALDGWRNQRRPARPAKSVNRLCGDGYCMDTEAVQAASPQLSEAQIESAVALQARSIQAFVKANRLTACLVYVPSPATLYDSRAPIVFQGYGNGTFHADLKVKQAENLRRSLLIRTQLKEALRDPAITFLDTTAAMQQGARRTFLHGSLDRQHFSSAGYRLLAESIVARRPPCLNSP